MKTSLYVYTLVLLLLAVLPINNPESTLNSSYALSLRWDYLAHALIHIPWAIFLVYALQKDAFGQVRRVVLCIGVAFAFATLTEYIQAFLPYRSFNVNDLIANLLGVITGLILAKMFKRKLQNLLGFG